MSVLIAANPTRAVYVYANVCSGVLVDFVEAFKPMALNATFM